MTKNQKHKACEPHSAHTEPHSAPSSSLLGGHPPRASTLKGGKTQTQRTLKRQPAVSLLCFHARWARRAVRSWRSVPHVCAELARAARARCDSYVPHAPKGRVARRQALPARGSERRRQRLRGARLRHTRQEVRVLVEGARGCGSRGPRAPAPSRETTREADEHTNPAW
jgi:hypothetical protein